jgi:predicted TIM-barrel fold metal-dependent hydrolase
MVMLLAGTERARVVGAETLAARSPIPLRLVSNGEYSPVRAPRLARLAARLDEGLATGAARVGLSRDDYLATPSALALGFAAMNQEFGAHFEVGRAEPFDLEEGEARRQGLASQFVFDDQVHFLRDDADPALFQPLTGLIEYTADLLKLDSRGREALPAIKFENFLKEIYLDSDTSVALLSGAPSDREPGWMLTNDMMAAARAAVNAVLGERRLLTHAVIAPGHPGWLDEIDRVHEVLRPDGWKGYTVGEPFSPSERRWFLDDERLMYPAYGKLERAGVRNLCIHKGLLPANADEVMPGAEPHARVEDVARAARDWPGLNFVIYHAGYRTIPAPTEGELERFERTGRIDWVTDLVELVRRDGLTNVYADIGASFAFTVLTHPRLCAAMLGTLVDGLGADHVLWGTDSVWYGSPQWQIEALRRLELPEDLRRRFGWNPLGPADGPVKRAILGGNAARLYGVDPAACAGPLRDPGPLARIRDEYRRRGGRPSHQAYGFVLDEPG